MVGGGGVWWGGRGASGGVGLVVGGVWWGGLVVESVLGASDSSSETHTGSASTCCCYGSWS